MHGCRHDNEEAGWSSSPDPNNGVLAGSAVADGNKGRCVHPLCRTDSVGYAAGFHLNGTSCENGLN
jgi:hypothetical protein